MSKLRLAIMTSALLSPARVLAHGSDGHGKGGVFSHIGFLDVALGLGVIVTIALAWALMARKRR